MKLYMVTNGFQGYGVVKVFVIAESEEKALELAREEYKRDANDTYGENYYSNLAIKCMCEDVSEEWCSEVTED